MVSELNQHAGALHQEAALRAPGRSVDELRVGLRRLVELTGGDQFLGPLLKRPDVRR